MKTFFQVTASIVLATALVPAAEATPGVQTGTIRGYSAEIVESGSWAAPDFITVYGPNGPEQITVTCAPFTWQSYGANTQAFAGSIASEWCF